LPRSKVTWPVSIHRTHRTRIVDLRWVNICALTVVVGEPNFTKFLVFDAGENVVDEAVYHLSIALRIPEIFAVKVERCHKSRRILDIFALPNSKGAVP